MQSANLYLHLCFRLDLHDSVVFAWDSPGRDSFPSRSQVTCSGDPSQTDLRGPGSAAAVTYQESALWHQEKSLLCADSHSAPHVTSDLDLGTLEVVE